MFKPGKKVLSLFLSLFLVIPLLAFSGMQASAHVTPPPPPPPSVEPVLGKTAALVTGTTDTWEITVTVAGRDGTVLDTIDSNFDLISPLTPSGGKNYVVYNGIWARYRSSQNTLAWGISSASTSDTVTFKYQIQIKDTAELGQTYPTNGVTTFTYGGSTKDFPAPSVTLPDGAIQVKGYLVDKGGNPVDEDGNGVAEPKDAKILYEQPFIPEGSDSSALTTDTYTVPAPEVEHYSLLPGEADTQDITVNPSNPSGTAWFMLTQYKYVIEYYKDDELVKTSDPIYDSLGASITFDGTAPQGVDLDGYKLDADNTKTLTIAEDEDSNVLKVYYVKDTFSYMVKYYKDNEETPFDAYESTALFKDVIDDYPDRAPVGYVRSDVTGKPLTITSDPEKNIIKVYYVKGTYGYTVNYFKDGSGTPFAQSSLNAKFSDVINSYENKAPTGYVLDTASGLPLTIGNDESKNVINVSYKKGEFAYKIEYYKEGSGTPFDTASGKGIFGDVISAYGDKTPSGYTFFRVVGGPLTISENEGNNVIKVYYKLVPVTPTTGENSSKTLLPMLFACGSLCGGLIVKKESLRKKAKA